MNPYVSKMGRGGVGRRMARRARVEIVPLIDVMFLLVAFFMVVSISMVLQKGIVVDLAPAESADASLADDTLIVVSVDAAGGLFLNKDAIDAEALGRLLLEKAQENKDTAVVLNADKNARHKDVVTALDIIRKSTLHNVTFSVEPTE